MFVNGYHASKLTSNAVFRHGEPSPRDESRTMQADQTLKYVDPALSPRPHVLRRRQSRPAKAEFWALA